METTRPLHRNRYRSFVTLSIWTWLNNVFLSRSRAMARMKTSWNQWSFNHAPHCSRRGDVLVRRDGLLLFFPRRRHREDVQFSFERGTMSLADALATIQRQTTTYVYSFYLIFGLSGCLLNILLLSRRQFRTVSCCICKSSDDVVRDDSFPIRKK